jgi:hypothetical protein
MKARMVGVVAAVAIVALAVFAATGFGGEGEPERSVDTDYSTPRVDGSELHRVAAPSGPVSASALSQASRKKGKKPKILFFETVDPTPIPAGGAQGVDIECPNGKVLTGYFLASNEDTFLGLTAPSSLISWLVGVKNTAGTATEAIFGVVCAKGVK